MRELQFKKRSIGRSLDEWTAICLAHIGWVCMIDEKIYHINNCAILILNEPYVPGQHGKAVMFRDWAREALKDNAEWRLEAWQKTLRPLNVEGGIDSADKNTSDSLQTVSEATDFTLSKVESILSEVLDPGMCESVFKVFGTESNAKEEDQKAPSEQLPQTSSTTTSSGIHSGQMEIPSLPF